MTAILALAITAMPAALLSQTTASATNAPITLRYIKTGEFNDHGYLSYGTTFWATNHTAKALMIRPWAIEVRAGSNWITRPIQSLPLLFRPVGTPLTDLLLPPHVAGYPTLEPSVPPKSGSWRLKVDVDAKLSGSAETARHLQLYPSLMERRFRDGNTNIPVSPLSNKMRFYKSLGSVVSQVISVE
jgi:hypothetical protein